MHHHNITYYSFYGVALLEKLMGCQCWRFHSSVAEIFVLLGCHVTSQENRDLSYKQFTQQRNSPNFHATQSFIITFTTADHLSPFLASWLQRESRFLSICKQLYCFYCPMFQTLITQNGASFNITDKCWTTDEAHHQYNMFTHCVMKSGKTSLVLQ